jgi:hypothetical protein
MGEKKLAQKKKKMELGSITAQCVILIKSVLHVFCVKAKYWSEYETYA